MHSRPLLRGDFNRVYMFLQDLIPSPSLPWTFCTEIFENISKDPTIIYTAQVPYTFDNYDIVENNLPIPDFDETGFIGRDADTYEIKKQILTNPHNGVVSIIGDGGVGKTALAVKIA